MKAYHDNYVRSPYSLIWIGMKEEQYSRNSFTSIISSASSDFSKTTSSVWTAALLLKLLSHILHFANNFATILRCLRTGRGRFKVGNSLDRLKFGHQVIGLNLKLVVAPELSKFQSS